MLEKALVRFGKSFRQEIREDIQVYTKKIVDT